MPARPGSPAKRDHEYERAGIADLFIAVGLLDGWRHAEVAGRKTAVDFAYFLRLLSDGPLRDGGGTVRVCDNLGTHTPACHYEAFGPEEARRLALRFEWRYTPKHGSWLNVGGCEMSVVALQCLGLRISGRRDAEAEMAAWVCAENWAVVKVDWQFTTADARVKLKRLYPVVQLQ